MSTAVKTPNTALGIRLGSGVPKIYSPGDTIHGVIYRDGHIVAPNANLTVSIQGISKGSLVFGNPGGERIYRSEFNFFEPETTAQILWDGPLHVEPGSDEARWPFSITIPTSLDHSALIRSESRDASYLPLDYGATASLHPPASYHGGKLSITGSVDASVKYLVLAELKVFAQGKSDVEVANKPVKVRVYKPTLVGDYSLTPAESDRLAISHRLVPGMEDVHLSFSQKTLQAFGSKKVPTFAFQIRVEMPTILQLEGPSHIPVRLHAIADWEKTTEIIRNIPQKLRLTSLNMHIAAMTEVIGLGFTTFNIKHTHRLYWKVRYSVGDQKGVMEGSEVVDILPPVAPEGDWIQPPPEDDPPPPFSV